MSNHIHIIQQFKLIKTTYPNLINSLSPALYKQLHIYFLPKKIVYINSTTMEKKMERKENIRNSLK